MEFPQNVLRVVEKAVEKHPTDIEAAVTQAERAVRKLDEFSELVDTLVRHAIQELVYDCRHHMNVATKNQNGEYDNPAKVTSAASSAVQRAADSVYLFKIAGTILGDLTGKELPVVAANETAVASGHAFNAWICNKLSPLVPEDKRVRDAVSEKKLRSIFQQAQEETQGEAGEATDETDDGLARNAPKPGERRYETEGQRAWHNTNGDSKRNGSAIPRVKPNVRLPTPTA